MENYSQGSPSSRRRAYSNSRTLLSTVDSVDESDGDGKFPPEVDPDRSVRSDEGYASHRRRYYTPVQLKAEGTDRPGQVEKTATDSDCSSSQEYPGKSDSSTSLRISSDDDLGRSGPSEEPHGQTWSPKSSRAILAELSSDLNPAQENATQSKHALRTAHPVTNRFELLQNSVLVGEANTKIPTTDQHLSVPSKGNQSASSSPTTWGGEHVREKKSTSTPELRGSFFSRSPLSRCVNPRHAHKPVRSDSGRADPHFQRQQVARQGSPKQHKRQQQEKEHNHEQLREANRVTPSQVHKTRADPGQRGDKSPRQGPGRGEEGVKMAEQAETTSQQSSVSSCYSLTENINRHARADRTLDFGYLKSAMKKSSQGEGQGHRRLSLFNSVMRRVSIHRRESTPTSRIATFLFGVDDAKGETKKADSDQGSKDVSGDSLLEAQRAKRAANLRESLFQILSGLYGILIVILGAVIPITEIFIPETFDSTFEGFYIYLYSVSILFLVYVYAYLLRRNRLKTEFLTRTLSRSLSWSKALAKSWPRTDTETRSKFRKRMISLDVSNHHTGTFYLRLGVLGFGIGSMIHTGLYFGSFVSLAGGSCEDAIQSVKPLIHLVFVFFQLYFIFMNSKMCIHRYKKLARFGLVHMCSTNICVWFRSIVVETLHVINHSHDHIHHLPGTNHSHDKGHHGSGTGYYTGLGNSSIPHDGHGSTLSSQNTTDHDVYKIKPHFSHSERHHLSRTLMAALASDHSHTSPAAMIPDAGHHVPRNECQWKNMMTKAVEAAGPYLYPCTIEYSLMCAGILYIMWTNVGKRPRRPTRSELETDSEGGEDEDEQRAQRMSVDCTSSSRGLFLGILLMVGTIISIIAFYMLVNQEEMGESVIILTHMSGTFIYTVTLLALLLAAGRMKNLSFHNDQEANLEDILIIISYTGLLAFIIFSLIASILVKTSTMSTMTILSNVSMLVQATVQTIFMLAGDRMSAATEYQVRKKPGREFITFLLISNFAMWAINTFQTQTPHHNPIQVEFYGPVAWAIFTHISVPLGIYYRFHSTVCFSNIWKNAWKKRKHV